MNKVAIYVSIHSKAIPEGSWQFGLSEGDTHAQLLFEYDNNYSATATGLQPEDRPLYVDLLSDTEASRDRLYGAGRRSGQPLPVRSGLAPLKQENPGESQGSSIVAGASSCKYRSVVQPRPARFFNLRKVASCAAASASCADARP